MLRLLSPIRAYFIIMALSRKPDSSLMSRSGIIKFYDPYPSFMARRRLYFLILFLIDLISVLLALTDPSRF